MTRQPGGVAGLAGTGLFGAPATAEAATAPEAPAERAVSAPPSSTHSEPFRSNAKRVSRKAVQAWLYPETKEALIAEAAARTEAERKHVSLGQVIEDVLEAHAKAWSRSKTS